MKKLVLKTTFVALSTLFTFNATATAHTPALGKEYLEIRQVPSTQKEVLEFFSFYCPHCYDFELVHQIPNQVKKALPQGAVLKQYHVDFLGRQSKELTRAWALAMALGVEDNVKVPLFENARNNHIQSIDDIRTIFLANGVSAEQFDSGIHSFAVNALVNKQHQAAEAFKVRGVPSFFVNEQYQLNVEGFSDSKSTQEFVQRYIDTVLFLIKK
ncbi:thiol:disulfide interchange protein DsbA [Nicoletella semolina]|uniref:Thiol:disulfide interchange protein n=1 Tax=Nicoletella semolina TaxID=271160 RepID=A0A4R2N4C4_9PAST|nr:DsbA family protein [Nicoletella semolina]MDH2925076.1 thiol:disulfide interchange protein [Nicoletella semolina]TCP15407.1 thiol:disulfide interchange protein DsbA [Nicoletella semolina]